jgi:PAS domain S-box-containing protein
MRNIGVSAAWPSDSGAAMAGAGTSSGDVHGAATLDALPGLAWQAGADGRATFFNREWSAVTGRQLVGDEWLDLLHPDDRPRVRAEWADAVRHARPFRTAFRLRRADGAYGHYVARMEPRRAAGRRTFLGLAMEAAVGPGAREPEPLRVAAGPPDDRARLEACQERNHLLTLATHDVIWEWDLATDRVSWNEAVETTFGYPRAEVGDDLAWWSERVHPDDRPRILEALRRKLEDPSARDWSAEYRFRHRNGRWLDVLDRGYVARDEAGHAIRMIGSLIDLTERKRAEEELRRSEAQFRYLADAMPQLVWTTRPDGSTEYVNHQWIEFTGTTREDVIGGQWVPLLHPDDRERTLARWRHCLETGEPYEIEYRFRRAADGVYFWFLTRANPVRDERGRILRWFGTSTNIEDRKRAERALRASESRFRRLVELSSQIVWVTDAAGRPSEDSPSWRAFTGMTTEEWLADWPAALHPDDRDRVLARWRQAVESGDDYEVEYRTRNIRGEYRIILARAAALRNPDGSIREWIGMNSDITERKHAEEALARSEARYRSLFLNLAEEVYLWRLEFDDRGRLRTWRLVDANPAALRAWGKTLEEIEGRRPDEAFGEGAEAFFRPTLEEILRAGVPHTGEDYYPLGDSYLLVTTIPMGDSFISTATDVTDLRKAVIRADEALARLREADRNKDEFLAMLSHELRNPLAPIRNSLFLLGRAPPGSDSARRALAVIDRQVLHMTRLIDDLLDVTRISRGKIRLQRERLELGDLARRTADDHREAFERSGIAFAVRIDPTPLHVQGDPTRLAQVIGNLLGNAAKFTPAGGHVEFALERRGDQAELRVRDDGAGIAPELAPHLFEPFVQAAQTLDRNRGGLGLGLALVKGLAEMHGGAATANSEGPGRGSTFTVRLPLDRSVRAPAGVPEAAGPRGRARRVLVVEDNVDAAETLRDVLEFDGHRVEVAGTGPEALAKFPTFEPEVVFCDIGLPGMDGYQVARALRDEGRDAYLVALSGYAAPEDVERARAAGFDEHLAKPVDLAAVERVLADGRGGGPGGRSGGPGPGPGAPSRAPARDASAPAHR